MSDARKCYEEYINSKTYVANDGWHRGLYEAMDAIEGKMPKEDYMKFENAVSEFLGEIEARTFAAGFNSASRMWVCRMMESTQEDVA